MSRQSSIVTLAVCALLVSGTPAFAQWLDHPTPGITRTKDGKPDLAAPAPRTADGKPDLSGLWQIDGLGFATNVTDTPMRPAADRLFKQRVATYANDDPAVGCLPEGPRTSLAGLDPLRIVQSPYLIAILYETGQYRQIFTDARQLPKDPNPTWMGYSVGRWDGDTLVVETTNFKEHPMGLSTSLPSSTRKRLTERFRLSQDRKSLNYSGVIEDPVYLARPVEWSGQWLYRPNMPHSNEKCDLDVARKFLSDFE